MNPKPGWVMNMANIDAMLARVDFLEDIREKERAKAAVQLQNEIATFVAHYGYVVTDECPSTCLTYVLGYDETILRKKEEDDAGEIVTTKDISISEMEFLHKFMKEVINNDSKYIEDEIDRYIDLCQ